MKRQYVALLVVLVMLVLLSLWVAGSTTTHDIERELTNTSNEQHGNNEGLIEGENLLLYASVTVVLFIVATGAYLLVAKKK